MANLRKHFRYSISAPAKFKWGLASEAERPRGEGVTKEVSLTSSFVWSVTCPPAGADIECEIFLPRAGNLAREIKAVVEGVVGRVELPAREHGIRGFVLMHRKMEIVDRQTEPALVEAEPASQSVGKN